MSEPAVLTISARNCEAAIGMSWAWARRFAKAHGVPVFRVGERKVLIDGAALLTAIRAHEPREAEATAGTVDELDAMRSRLGLRRRQGAA